MKFKIGLGAGIAVALGAGISAALAQVTLTSTNGTLICSSHNGVQVSSTGAITINVGSCDLGTGTGGGTGGGDGGTGGELPAAIEPSTSLLAIQEGGNSSFTLSLNRPPAQNVALNLNISPSGVVTLDDPTLTFSPTITSRTVTVTGSAAGSATISGTTSSTGDFSGLPVNVSVSVSPASTGGGTGGSDPGFGQKWQTTFQGKKVFVVDRSAYSNRTYFPGCLSKNWPELGLSHNSSLNPFDGGGVTNTCRRISSLRAGEIYAQRLPFKTSTGPFTIELARAESGETGGQVYDISISSIPGNLDPTEFPTDRCVIKGVVSGMFSLVGRNQWEQMSSRTQKAYCPLNEDTVYYFNFAPSPGSQGATSCGKGGYICRAIVFDSIPASFYQDVRVASENY